MEYTCKYCGESKTAEEMDVTRHHKPSKSCCRKCRWQRGVISKKKRPDMLLVQWARHRARVEDIPFNITADDISIPTHCPVLGIPLEVGTGKQHDGSPTIERIISERGYTKGNVAVISYKANRMKNNSTLTELKQLVAWLESRTICETDGVVPEPLGLGVRFNSPNRRMIPEEMRSQPALVEASA